MSQHLSDLPSSIYRFKHTPSGRRPLGRNQVARAIAFEQAQVHSQLLWSIPMAGIIAPIAVFAGTMATASITIYVAQLLALVGMLPAAMYMSRWSRLQQAQRASSTS